MMSTHREHPVTTAHKTLEVPELENVLNATEEQVLGKNNKLEISIV